MAQFYAEIQGSRGKASRMGTKNSGMWAHIRGWNVGVYVECSRRGDKDVIEVYSTPGSNGGGSKLPIATLTRLDGGSGVTVELAKERVGV